MYGEKQSNLSLNSSSFSSSRGDYVYIQLSRVYNVNKQKQKEETAGSSGDSLNQKRRSLLCRFLLDALVLNLGYQLKP